MIRRRPAQLAPAPPRRRRVQLDQRAGRAALLVAITFGLAVVIAAPIALSSRDLVEWAASTDGLDLPRDWAWFVFVALDLAAGVCVGMVVYAAWRGESAGVFGVLVWVFAGASAWANYRHGVRTPARDDQWFYPAMSLAGPALLEAVVRRVRRWVQTAAGRYEAPLPHFRITRWLVAPRETALAWRLAVTEGHATPEAAVEAARAVRVAQGQEDAGDEGQAEVEGQRVPTAEDIAADIDRDAEARRQRDAERDAADWGLQPPAEEPATLSLVPHGRRRARVSRPAAGRHRHSFDPEAVARLTAGGAMSVRNARRRLECTDPECPDRPEEVTA